MDVKLQMFGGKTCQVHVKVDHAGNRNSIQEYAFAARAQTLNRFKIIIIRETDSLSLAHSLLLEVSFQAAAFSCVATLTLALNVRRLTSQFKLNQLVDNPTRGDLTLDLVLTNLPQLYDKKF